MNYNDKKLITKLVDKLKDDSITKEDVKEYLKTNSELSTYYRLIAEVDTLKAIMIDILELPEDDVNAAEDEVYEAQMDTLAEIQLKSLKEAYQFAEEMSEELDSKKKDSKYYS